MRELRICERDYNNDVDIKINQVVELTQKFIKELKEELGEEDYKLVSKAVINEHLESL